MLKIGDRVVVTCSGAYKDEEAPVVEIRDFPGEEWIVLAIGGDSRRLADFCRHEVRKVEAAS